MTKTHGRTLIGWFMVGALGLGCSSILEFDEVSFESDVPPDGGMGGRPAGTQCGNVAVGNSECAACIDQTCCSQAEACGNTPACVALALCRNACHPQDLACLSSCSQIHATGAQAWQALESCYSASCPACASGSSGTGGSGGGGGGGEIGGGGSGTGASSGGGSGGGTSGGGSGGGTSGGGSGGGTSGGGSGGGTSG
ncbi:MAG TPA: hypothetical protein PLV85_06035, partial [Polyangiaceae bacterium]|nr:hypothetical protein [Polyangiaceae bacterium]